MRFRIMGTRDYGLVNTSLSYVCIDAQSAKIERDDHKSYFEDDSHLPHFSSPIHFQINPFHVLEFYYFYIGLILFIGLVEQHQIRY